MFIYFSSYNFFLVNSESASTLDANIVKDLKKMLHEHNVLVKSFKMVREAFKENELINVS